MDTSQIKNNILYTNFANLVANKTCGGLNSVVETLGEFVKAQRDRRGWTQGHLAGLLKVTPQTILNLENGKTKSLKTGKLPLLAETFGVPVSEILDRVVADHDTDPVGYSVTIANSAGTRHYPVSAEMDRLARERAEVTSEDPDYVLLKMVLEELKPNEPTTALIERHKNTSQSKVQSPGTVGSRKPSRVESSPPKDDYQNVADERIGLESLKRKASARKN
jgi:transcriptional regulator with XRE-family HTH domain